MTKGRKKLKIVVDINHPGHVHFFKHFIWQMKANGHKILVTASQKDVAIDLLKEYKIPFVYLGSYGDTPFKKFLNIPWMDVKMIKATRKFNPDILVGVASVRAAHTAYFLGKKSFIFDDTDQKRGFWLYLPFCTKVFTPSCFKKNLGSKQVSYSGYHELAYLLPKYFRPNSQTLEALGIKKGEKFFIVRFVSWRASHDIGAKGFSDGGKRNLIKKLSQAGRIIISSEARLPFDLEKYRFKTSASKMHDLIYFATACISEGATMVSEAAALGTPGVFMSSLSAGTLAEQEKKYNLIYSFSSEKKALRKIDKLLKIRNLKQKWQPKRERMLRDKIDVTKMMVDQVKLQKDESSK